MRAPYMADLAVGHGVEEDAVDVGYSGLHLNPTAPGPHLWP